ncbi:MAG: hypothetical protein HDR01_00135 [Lachnospiraceae bacterium]|nr:hypothetical protein [Lachnospiraceae bacterium]
METKDGFYLFFEKQTIVSLTDYAKSIQKTYELVSEQMNTLFYQGFSKKRTGRIRTLHCQNTKYPDANRKQPLWLL